MDLRSLLLIFRKRLLFIIFVPLLCGLLAALVSKFLLTPVYEAKSLLMVTVAGKLPQATLNTQIRPGTDAGAVPMPVLTMNTYLEHLRSEDVMNRVLININIPELTPGKLNRMINARIVKDSNLIEVKVQNSDPILAAQIANAVSHQYMQLMEELQFSSIMVLSSANILPLGQAP